ncbi:hypothetical protein [Halalkalicoccus tibetensis]|uniref:ParB-like nuclease domain-containing protein n=1 Tax=Halalkalicoccus tibetensis TaxID=175632 RepID=A0ABD5V2T2_9EURY
MTVVGTLRKAVARWRDEGLVTLIRAALSRSRDRVKRRRLRRKYRYVSDDGMISVDPERITHFLVEGRHPATRYRVEKGLVTKHELIKAYFPVGFFRGAVLPGEWDRHGKAYHFDRVYRGIRNHYVEGVEWERTEYGHQMLLLDDLYDYSYFDRRISQCESLYRSLNRDGYEPAPRPERNVGVNVGRDGTLIFNNKDGHNRLALARVLGIDRIPVVVVVRHARWQALREEIAAAETIDELGDRARRHLDHPDVRSLHEFNRADRSADSALDRLERFVDRSIAR